MATVAITGAGRGIAFELVKLHAAAGDRVLALVRNPAGAAALNALAAQSGGQISVHRVDVGDPGSIAAGVAETGDGPVDVVYNVAGVLGTLAPELESADWAAWDETYAIMVKGPLAVLQAFLPRLGAGAKVINFTSQLGASTWPYGGLYAYASAKAALNRLMRSVATDLKPRGIVVGLVHPGYVQTDMSGPGADITPLESAEGVYRITQDWTLDATGEFLNWDGRPHAW